MIDNQVLSSLFYRWETEVGYDFLSVTRILKKLGQEFPGIPISYANHSPPAPLSFYYIVKYLESKYCELVPSYG